jgi:hypothetical protein
MLLSESNLFSLFLVFLFFPCTYMHIHLLRYITVVIYSSLLLLLYKFLVYILSLLRNVCTA